MSKRDTSPVVVPKWALAFVLDLGCFQDEGPMPEGWSSDEMKAAVKALEDALAGPPLMPVYGSREVEKK